MAKSRDLFVNIVVKGATGFERAVTGMESRLKKLDRALGKVGRRIVGFLSVRALKGWADETVAAFSELQESVNAVGVVFGDAQDDILAFSEEAAESAGLAKSEFNQMAAEVGNLLIGFGLNADEAAEKTIALTQRAADMASVYNTDVSQALEAIQSGLARQIRPLRTYAVNLEASRVAAKAVEMGLADTTAEVDLNADALARLEIIMEQTEIVAGDFVNTSEDYANAMRIANAEIKNQEAAIGEGLVPAYQGLKLAAASLAPDVAILALKFAGLTGAMDSTLSEMKQLELMTGTQIGSTEFFVGALGQMGKQWAHVQEKVADYTQEIIDMTGATKPQMLHMRNGLDNLVESGVLTAATAATMAEVLSRNLSPSTQAMTQHAQMLEWELDQIHGTGQNLPPVLGDVAETADESGRAFGRAEEEARGFREELLRLADPAFNLIKTQEDAEEAARNWAEAINESGAESREARDAYIEYAKALAELAAAGEGIDDAAVESFRSILLEAGLAKDAVDALILSLFGVGSAGSAAKPPKTTIPLPGGRSIYAFHEGGIVPGTPGMNVPIMAQAGEEITRRAETHKTQPGSGLVVQNHITVEGNMDESVLPDLTRRLIMNSLTQRAESG